MERFVQELKKLVPLKDTTAAGDIVLIAAKEPQMLMYAKVNGIERDSSRRDEWWHLHLSVLSIPLQKMVWTLRTAQMTGAEIFTMGGEARFVQAVDFSEKEDVSPDRPASNSTGKITPLRRVK
ncbi:MAG: hypothetical protein ACK5PS_18520 [Desulfopila sp.]